MDRCALFVDAGYLFAQGGKICVGSPDRQHVQLDAGSFRDSFAQTAFGKCGLPSLRTYWYDAARNGVPTIEQQVIASLANVKLRLGRLSGKKQQKGVDALIYRDLMTLARERAICEGFLLSGDEDLREGVKAAQDMGVRVTLVVIAGSRSRTYSRALADEADEVIELRAADLTPHISRSAAPAVPAAGPPSQPASASVAAAAQAAAQFADDWLGRAADTDIAALLKDCPRIPGPLDTAMLVATEGKLGVSLRGQDQLRREMRHAFWNRIRECAGGTASRS